MKCRLVVFQEGRRIEKPYDDHTEAAATLKKLTLRGVKVRLVTNKVIEKFKYPPADDNLYLRGVGMRWCVYCRDWSYFRVPKFVRGAAFESEKWFMNSMHRQGIKVCAWCHISEADFDIRRANGTWAEALGGKRRRKRKLR